MSKGRERLQDWYESLPDLKRYDSCTCKSVLGARVELCFYMGKDWVKLHRLEATEHGGGAAAMREILRVADEQGVEIRLDAGSYDTPCRVAWPQERLVAWYEQFGFVITGVGQDEDGELTQMRRMPNE